MKKYFYLLLLLSNFMVLRAQFTCTGTANIAPNGTKTINGVTITSASTGAVAQRSTAFNGYCTSLSANSLRVGKHAAAHDGTPAPWSVTLNFDQPVNDLVFILADGGISSDIYLDEDFIFNGNNGAINIGARESCSTGISGNKITSWSDGVGQNGGSQVVIHSVRPFTQLVINGSGGGDGSFIGICSQSISALPPVCNVSDAFSTTGWKATVYDGIDGMNGWAQISASTSFPTVSYTQVATFDYNEYAGSNTAFDVIFGTNTYGLTPANPKIQNYVGTQINNDPYETDPNKVNQDYAILFSKTIASGEAGIYQFDLGYGDDHTFIYKNGIKINQQENAYSVIPLYNFATLNVVVGDVISILVVEEYEFNTEVQMTATKLVVPPVVKNLTNICPSNTVNLNEAYTGTNPSGTSLVWYTNSTHTGAALSGLQITQAGAGVYYAFYYNNTGGCYSSASSKVTVTISICPTYCYKLAITTGTTVDTKHGITSLGRAGADNGNWPMVRKGAWTALESKTKGFVVNRIPTTAAIVALPNPVEGMMVYDIEAGCLKINTDGTPSGWKCFTTQTCP